jgi:hypothetical protein
MLPEREYLAKLGEFAYLVSALEWEILGDIRFAGTDLDVTKLLVMTTTQIGSEIEKHVTRWVKQPNLQSFAAVSAKALKDVGPRRNHVLHARPATTRGHQQRLLRLRETDDGTTSIWIDDEYLDKQIARVEYWMARVKSATLRLPMDKDTRQLG